MCYTVMEQYWIWLSSVEGIGPKRFYQLLSMFEDARQVWDALGDPEGRRAMKFLGRAALNKLATMKVREDIGRFKYVEESVIDQAYKDIDSALRSEISELIAQEDEDE